MRQLIGYTVIGSGIVCLLVVLYIFIKQAILMFHHDPKKLTNVVAEILNVIILIAALIVLAGIGWLAMKLIALIM